MTSPMGPIVCVIGHLDEERERAREAAETQECIGAHVVQNGYPARPSLCVCLSPSNSRVEPRPMCVDWHSDTENLRPIKKTSRAAASRCRRKVERVGLGGDVFFSE